MPASSLSVATWNVQWKRSKSKAAAVMRTRLRDCEADIICLTEGHHDFFGGEGHTISAEPDYGYPLIEGRRKVMLWSSRPWLEWDAFGDALLPGGRFVRGRTETALGIVNVVGVCVPWRSAHVKTGRRDRQQWEDHLAYLKGLGPVLRGLDGPTVVLGDFNQRVPRRYQPEAVHAALVECLGDRLSIATQGPLSGDADLSIDHIACSQELQPLSVQKLSNVEENGRNLSDHFGAAARLGRICP